MTKCMQTLSIWNIADTSKAQLNHSRGALYGITPWQKLRWQVLNSEFLNGFPLTLSLLFEHSQDVIATAVPLFLIKYDVPIPPPHAFILLIDTDMLIETVEKLHTFWK